MDYEQKYNEALERAREYKKYGYMMINVALDNIFPELKESEDERIRKEIIAFIKKRDRSGCDYDYDNWIAWLEKQGEKPRGKSALEAIKDKKVDNANRVEPKFKVKYAGSEYNVLEIKEITGVTYYGIEDEPNHIDYVLPDDCEIISGYDIKENGSSYPTKPAMFSEQKSTDNVKPKFKTGDWICNGGGNPCKVNYIFCNYYELCSTEGYEYTKPISDIDANYHLWNIADAKDRDILTVNGRPFIYCCNDDYKGNYCCIDSDGVFRTNLDFGFNGKTILPATKEQRDTLFAKMREAGYEWDAEKKKLIN